MHGIRVLSFLCIFFCIWVSDIRAEVEVIETCEYPDDPKKPTVCTYRKKHEPLLPGELVAELETKFGVSCDKAGVDKCLGNVQTFLHLDSLPFTSDAEKLNELCQKTLAGYKCSVMLFNTQCLSDNDRDMIPLFVSMAEHMFRMLCGNAHDVHTGYLTENFLQNSACILENKEKIDCCFNETEMPALPVLRVLEESSKEQCDRQISSCCPFTRYLKCAMNAVNESCGDVAANVTHEFIRRAAGERIQLLCQELPNYPEPDTTLCPAPAPTCSGSWRVEVQGQLMMIAYVFVFYLTKYAVC